MGMKTAGKGTDEEGSMTTMKKKKGWNVLELRPTEWNVWAFSARVVAFPPWALLECRRINKAYDFPMNLLQIRKPKYL